MRVSYGRLVLVLVMVSIRMSWLVKQVVCCSTLRNRVLLIRLAYE